VGSNKALAQAVGRSVIITEKRNRLRGWGTDRLLDFGDERQSELGSGKTESGRVEGKEVSLSMKRSKEKDNESHKKAKKIKKRNRR